MQTIQAARLIPGARLDDTPAAEPVGAATASRTIRGKALIFWDAKIPGKKRDAIDTDQITPADDCVSESLDTLDARWKAGSFRYLMPDFRERVQRGDTFIVAGDRFAIGSSRGVNPAGLQGGGGRPRPRKGIVFRAAEGGHLRPHPPHPRLPLGPSRAALGHAHPGAPRRVFAAPLPASDGAARFATHTFTQTTGGEVTRPRQIAIANDHFVFNRREADDKQTEIGRQFAERHGIQRPYYATPGDGIFHFYFPEQGLVLPGALIPGADSHSRAYGAYGALGYGVGSTTLGFGWATGYVYFTVARQRRVVFTGELQPWVSGKDVVLALLARWGAKQSQGMSVEFVDRAKQLPMSYRNTIANMMAEGEALNGIFAPDEITYAWFRDKGMTDLPYPRFAPGDDARYELDETLDLSEGVPLIAKPFSPANAFPATEIARDHVTFDKAFIGSCTNGGYGDLLEAALVLRAARAKGASRAMKEFVVFPGSGGVKRDIEKADPRLGGESIASGVPPAGGESRESRCGPCSWGSPSSSRSFSFRISSRTCSQGSRPTSAGGQASGRRHGACGRKACGRASQASRRRCDRGALAAAAR